MPYIVYSQATDLETLTEKVSLVFTGLFFNVLVASILLHISKLNQRLEGKYRQSVKLLNGMHEGLLIVAKNQQSHDCIEHALYCNRSASKLLSRAILQDMSQSAPGCEDPDSKAEAMHGGQEVVQVLGASVFVPVDITTNGIATQSDASVTLEQIITSQINEPQQKGFIYSVELDSAGEFSFA